MASPRNLAVEHWEIGRVGSDPRNPRTHPPDQIGQIVASIREFGWTNPILVGPDGVVIAGEARLAAARAIGLAEVPVIVLTGLTPAQRRAYQVADNRLPLGAAWDEELLAEVLTELQAADFDITVTGFSDAEIGEIFALLSGENAGADECAAPAVQPVAVTRPDELWELGRHRVICGDSTDPTVIKRLVGPVKTGTVVIDMTFTDPPYGMAYDGGRAVTEVDLVVTDPPYGMKFGAGRETGSTAKGAIVKAHGQILGDDAAGDDLIDLVAGAMKAARQVCHPGAAFYVCLTWRTYREFLAALEAANLRVAACIVWDKKSIGLGHQHYRPQHEFIFYCKGDRWFGGRDEGDVWALSRGNTESYIHPTQKPVALIRRAIENSSIRGDAILDPFGGSGSTLIACEETGRRAFLSEKDPKYCDAIIRRWQHGTSASARLIGDGRTFDEIAAARTA